MHKTEPLRFYSLLSHLQQDELKTFYHPVSDRKLAGQTPLGFSAFEADSNLRTLESS